MGGPQGHAPGRVVEFDRQLHLVKEHPDRPPDDGFNPHGISVRPELNLMVTSDFICPATTLHAVPGDLALRGSVRVWDFKARRILRSVTLPTAAGSIDVKLIPHDRRGRAYTAGMTDDQLYLVDTRRGTAHAVFDFGSVAKGGWPQLMRMTADGERLFITLNVAGKVVMLNTSDPERPQLMKVVDLGPASGPHYLALTADERRLVVSDYFLNEDDAGKVHAEGDHRVHVLKVSDGDLAVDERFQLDFNTAVATGPARPHGMAFK
jgi:selenium-binding protein 1